MKLLSYGPAGRERAGFLHDGGVVDLQAALVLLGADTGAADLVAFLARPGWRELLARLPAAALGLPRQPLAGVRLGAPVPCPRQVLLAGVNYRSHQREAVRENEPTRPVVLGKMASAIVGPHDAIVRPAGIAKLDYEGELAVVVGRTMRNVAEAAAMDHVAGFTVMNDVSGRDLQLAEHESNPFFRMHYLGKSADTFGPTGPWLVTTDEIDTARPFRIRTWVDGELRQDGSTDSLIFGIPAFLSYVSRFCTLQPGDLVAMGTPGGVGHYMAPPTYLRHGQRVRVEVEGIGAIENPVVDEAGS